MENMGNYLIANFDRKEYLQPEQFGEHANLGAIVASYDGVLNALAILLSDGNNRGGGDLRSDHPVIGTWAGNRIAIINETVTCFELSEPGMQAVPLYEQMLMLGRDVSSAAVAAIMDGEGAHTALSSLNPLLTLPLTYQRSLGAGPMQVLGTSASRKQPLSSFESFLAVLGAGKAWSPYVAKKQLKAGLLNLAEGFGHAARYDVLTLNETLPGEDGLAGVSLVLKDLATRKKITFEFSFGTGGSSADAVLKAIFPGVAFELQPTLSDSVTSPEVAKLLSMIPNLEA